MASNDEHAPTSTDAPERDSGAPAAPITPDTGSAAGSEATGSVAGSEATGSVADTTLTDDAALEAPPRRARKRATKSADPSDRPARPRPARGARAAGRRPEDESADAPEAAATNDSDRTGSPTSDTLDNAAGASAAALDTPGSGPSGELDVDEALDAIDADAIDLPEGAQPEAEADRPAAAPAFGFGLLFQAPDPDAAATALSRRRTRRPAPEPEVDEAPSDEDAPEDTPSRGRSRQRDARASDASSASTDSRTDSSTDSSTDSGEGSDGADDDGDDDKSGRRRRRRGGKGRRRGGEEQNSDQDRDDRDSSGSDPLDESADSDNGEDNGDNTDGGGTDRGGRTPRGRGRSRGGSDSRDNSDGGRDTSADSEPDSDSDDDSAEGGRRRTRRRRRSGSATDGNDPPGTVTKVREPRPQRDEATGIKGSTRLEAKRQRRREGREAGRRRTIITEAEFLARRESVERVMVVRQNGAMTQIGVLEDGVLVEHYISGPGSTSHVAGSSMAGNVYLGRVQNVLPSMEAAFVDIGKGRNAVLYAGEVNWDAAGLEQNKSRRIENALSSGQSVLTQVTKDPIGHKGARLTSQVSLPGRYLVYVPDGSMTGISRKLPDTERARLKKILKEIVPDNAGVIVRTAAEGASEAELTADVERLTSEWDRIQKKAKSGSAPALLHGEPDLTVRVVRDVFNEDFSSLVVAGDDAWATVSDYVHSVAPDLAGRLTRWTGERDVFSEYRIGEQLAKAMDRKVWLPSGGSLVIDRTEAMTVIDVNTGKFTGAGGNLEETVTKNNIEAAEEIVRQLRLRDVGGIIVIDFIDMVLEANRDLVVRRLIECLGRDRTKHQVAEVTSLGLVQMTRKRVGAGLIEVFSEPCTHCDGRGVIVQAEPVDRSDSGAGSGGSGASGGESGRGRRGRKNKNDTNGNSGGSAGQQGQPAQPPASGPTPAQIAAAAYAAAVQAGHRDDDAGAASRTDSAVSEAAEAANAADVVKAIEAALPAPALPAPAQDGGFTPEGSRLPDPVQAAPTPAEADGAAGETPAPRRRGGRRAVRSAAGAPTSTTSAEPAVLVADPAGNPEVARVLAEPAPESVAPPAHPRSSSEVPESTETSEPVGAAPQTKRRKRARVVAPAGPPSAAESAGGAGSESSGEPVQRSETPDAADDSGSADDQRRGGVSGFGVAEQVQ